MFFWSDYNCMIENMNSTETRKNLTYISKSSGGNLKIMTTPEPKLEVITATIEKATEAALEM